MIRRAYIKIRTPLTMKQIVSRTHQIVLEKKSQRICATTWQNQQNECTQWKRRSACASDQSDQRLRCALNGLLRTQAFFMRTAKTLIRLGGCPGWSESSLGAHSLCWFCQIAAHMMNSCNKSGNSRSSPKSRSACTNMYSQSEQLFWWLLPIQLLHP